MSERIKVGDRVFAIDHDNAEGVVTEVDELLIGVTFPILWLAADYAVDFAYFYESELEKK